MNTQQAKKLDMFEVMTAFGCKPVKHKGNEILYTSPFRKERHPSFSVNIVKNVWIDFGLSKSEGSGKALEFVMRLKNVAVQGALKILENKNLSSVAGASGNQKVFEFLENNQRRELEKIQDLQNKALVQYLESRKISFQLADRYLKEIYYKYKGNDKSYFALAFPNDSGGYELKNKIMPGVWGNKEISSIEGENHDSGILVVFEAFVDFLSGLAYFGTDQPENNTIVLNTTNLATRIKDRLEGCKEIQCFLDRDKPGKDAFNEIMEIAGDRKVIDRSSLYSEHKDFNEFWVKNGRGLKR